MEHQHITHNFLKSNSTSVWASIVKLINAKFTTYDSNQDVSILSEISVLLHKLTEQIIIDEQHYNKGDFSKISDCALHMPRHNCSINTRYKHVNFRPTYICSNYMYIASGRMKEELHGMIHWSRLISTLSKAYVDEQKRIAATKSEFKINRVLQHQRKNWCELKQKTITKAIGKPEAMPVAVPPLEELQPFFNHLESNASLEAGQELKTFNRGTVFSDGRMDLCKQVVGPTWIGNLMESLKHNSQITHFLLGNNVTNTEGGKAIRNFLLNEHTPHIKTWYLAGSAFNSEAIKYITEGLSVDNDVEALWLKRNPIYAEGIKHIGKLLETNNTIKVLDLHNTAVGLSENAHTEESPYYEKYYTLDGVIALCEGLKHNTALRHLYLDANALTKESAAVLADYFQFKSVVGQKGLTSLWIDMNRLEDEGTRVLVESMSNYPYIKRLNLGSNMISEVGMKYICDAFKHHNGLRVLDLSLYKSTADMGTIPNNISDLGVESICELIRENKSLRYLNISMNNLSAEALDKISYALEDNTCIWYFLYSQYGVEIPQKIVRKINDVITRNREMCAGIVFDEKHMRYLKHSRKIDNIDSIYRNNMK